jgi:hypothetical protein
MSIKFGDRVVIVDKDKNGECKKGTIIDIWRFSNKEITDYLVQLDSGPYINVKPLYPNWFKLDNRILWFENDRLELSYRSPRGVVAVNN